MSKTERRLQDLVDLFPIPCRVCHIHGGHKQDCPQRIVDEVLAELRLREMLEIVHDDR